LNQEFVGGSSFEVLSSQLLEDRLLSLLLLVLVGSGEFVFWAMTDELRSSEKLDVRLLKSCGCSIQYSVMLIRGNGVTLRTQKVIQGGDNGHVGRPVRQVCVCLLLQDLLQNCSRGGEEESGLHVL
jgi:hypothetical protein